MANLDRIRDVVLEYADKYAQEMKLRAPVDTGRLKNSIRGVATEEDGKFKIQIFSEYYGPFQSYGVGPAVQPLQIPDGVNPPPKTGNTYKFRNPNRYIKATNFMGTALDVVTPKFAADLEEAGVKDIDDFFDSLSMIEVK